MLFELVQILVSLALLAYYKLGASVLESFEICVLLKTKFISTPSTGTHSFR